MSQRQVLRRGDMELSSSEFQQQSAAPQCTGDANKEAAIRAGPNQPRFSSSSSSSSTTTQRQQLQQLRGRGEQDHLLLKSPAVTNGRFSLLDILRETIYLARARKTYLLVVLSVFIVGVLLKQALSDFIGFDNAHFKDGAYSSELGLHCERKILNPWKDAMLRGNLTSAKQEEFQTLFRQKCTAHYESEAMDFFTFRKGTVEHRHVGFERVLPKMTREFVVVLIEQFVWVWFIWAQVAVALGVFVVARRRPSYQPTHSWDGSMQSGPPHTTSSVPPQGFMEALWELCSVRVRRGVKRVTLTETLIFFFVLAGLVLITLVRSFVKDKSRTSLASIQSLWEWSSHWSLLANQLPVLFLFTPAIGALPSSPQYNTMVLYLSFSKNSIY